jgi:hypothetical protein
VQAELRLGLGPPEMELIVTVSPDFIVQTGGSALSKSLNESS